VFYGSTCSRRWAYARSLSRDPGQAVAVLVTFALGCSQILARTPSPGRTSLILDRNCCGRLRVSLQLLFCFPLFSCQGTTEKQVLLASLPLSRDK